MHNIAICIRCIWNTYHIDRFEYIFRLRASERPYFSIIHKCIIHPSCAMLRQAICPWQAQIWSRTDVIFYWRKKIRSTTCKQSSTTSLTVRFRKVCLSNESETPISWYLYRKRIFPFIVNNLRTFVITHHHKLLSVQIHTSRTRRVEINGRVAKSGSREISFAIPEVSLKRNTSGFFQSWLWCVVRWA